MEKSLGGVDLENISISPKYRVSDWLTNRDNGEWSTMVDIFLDRIEGRFLNPARLINKDRSIGAFSGFAILALDCLIIETLSQFYNGTEETEGQNRKAFWNFFKGSEYFSGSFSRKKAFIFYSHFRCGILHQAQTKNKSLVRLKCAQMVESVDENISSGLIVDREKFHDALENEISSYALKLNSDNHEYSYLRENFINKMNIICGVNDS